MTIKVVEVRCDYSLDCATPGSVIECLKRLVSELEIVQSQGYVLENNPFQQNQAPVSKPIFRFIRNFSSLSEEQIREECEFGFNPEILWQGVQVLNLSTRATTILGYAAIHHVHQLVRKSYEEMLRLKKAGEKSVNEIRSKLQTVGLDFGMQLPKTIADSLPPLPLR